MQLCFICSFKQTKTENEMDVLLIFDAYVLQFVIRIESAGNGISKPQYFTFSQGVCLDSPGPYQCGTP
jgi:hypothetical protein